MTNRSRIFSFGAAGLLVLAGAACAVFVGGGSGGLLALVLIVPAGAVATLLVSSSRGVTGEISHLWSTATSLKTTARVVASSREFGCGRFVRGRAWSV